MDYIEFITKYNSNEISVDIDKKKAGLMYKQPDLMPQDLRAKQSMIRNVGFGGLVVGAVLFFFSPWWLATGVLVLSLLAFPQAQKTAAQGILRASLTNPDIYETALQNQVIRIK